MGKSCGKVQTGRLDSGAPGRAGDRAHVSSPARCAVVWKPMHSSVCEYVDACDCAGESVCARARPGHKVT